MVEDDRGVRHVIVSLVRRSTGLPIDDFESAADALAAARSTHYGIAVLDVGMAPMDGIELAAELEVLQPGLPIVYLTGGSSEDQRRALEAGAAAVLRKPSGVRTVGEVVRTHVRREPKG